jgi:hypothetical protein
MKRVFLTIIIFCMFAGMAQAVSLVCDKQTGVDYYVINGLPASYTGASNITPSTNPLYGILFDISTIPAGTYNVTAQACSNLWGCSANSVPLVFTRPVALVTPGGLGLIK